MNYWFNYGLMGVNWDSPSYFLIRYSLFVIQGSP